MLCYHRTLKENQKNLKCAVENKTSVKMHLLDPKELLFLRGIKRVNMSFIKPKGPGSPSGLEQYLPRTSTPTMETFTYVDDAELCDPYELFRVWVERPPLKVKVRGLKNPPDHFVSGHFVEPKRKPVSRFQNFKLSISNFFDKYYRHLFWNKCDYEDCPLTCECQKVKSLLNKTIVLDEEEQSRVVNKQEENLFCFNYSVCEKFVIVDLNK